METVSKADRGFGLGWQELRAGLQGDRRARNRMAARFCGAYQTLMYRAARIAGLGHEDAEDAVQDALVELLEDLRDGAVPGRVASIGAWIAVRVQRRAVAIGETARARQGGAVGCAAGAGRDGN